MMHPGDDDDVDGQMSIVSFHPSNSPQFPQMVCLGGGVGWEWVGVLDLDLDLNHP